MRVLHLRSQYFTDGGVETFLNGLFRYTDSDRARHEVTLLASPGIDRPGFCDGTDVPWEVARWSLRDLVGPLVRRVREQIDAGRVDLIHTHDNRADLLALLLRRVHRVGVPWLASGHGWVKTPLKSRLIQDVDREVIRFADAIHLAAQVLASELRRPPLDRICAIPYFVDPAPFDRSYDREAVRARWGVPPGSLVLGSIGRFTPEKGHAHLLPAFARVGDAHPDTRLVLVGEGPLRPELERLARRLGIEDRVIFTGFWPDATEASSAFDVVVHASLGETLSIVILEALHLGKPVVATAVGANDELVISGKNGELVPPADPAALGAALLALLDDRQRLPELAAASRERSAEFAPARLARRYERLYENVATGRAPAS